MALEFHVTALKTYEKNRRRYLAEIEFRGYTEFYSINCNNATQIFKNNSEIMITIDDRIPEKEDKENLHLRVEGITNRARKLEQELNDALIEFAFNQ